MRNLLFPCAPMESGKTADLSASEAAEMVIRKGCRNGYQKSWQKTVQILCL